MARLSAEQLWERIPKTPLCFLGWGVFGMWNNLMYRFPTVEWPALPAFADTLYEAAMVATFLAFAVLVRFRSNFAPLIKHSWVLPLSVALLLFCTTANFSAAAVGLAEPWLMECALVAGGVGTSIMMLALSEFFGFIHPRRSILYMASGWLVGTLLAQVLRVLPLAHLSILMTVIPVASALALWRAYHTLAPSELAYFSQKHVPFPWLPLVPVVLCVSVKRALVYLVPVTWGAETVNDVGMLAASMVVLVGLTIFGGNLNLRSIWKWGIAAMAVASALFVVAWLGKAPIVGTLSAILSSASYYMLFMLMTAILANMSYRYGVCALWLFSIEHASHLLVGNAAGVATATFASQSPITHDAACGLLAAFAAVSMVVIMLLFRRFSPDSLWGLSIQDGSSFGETQRLGLICDELVADHDLTAREGEILYMCLQSKKPQAIADELFIEVSTVRTHIKHIYAKLGIHSKQELTALVSSLGTPPA